MDVIADFARPYAFTRYAPPSSTKGMMDNKTIIVNDPATGLPWTMDASVQSLKYFEALNLPEGIRGKDSLKLYTQTALQVADTVKHVLGDRFKYKGYIYEIMMNVDWTDYDLPYFKYIGVKIDP